MDGRRTGQTRTTVLVVESGNGHVQSDVLATEEPLEIRLTAAGETRPVAVTMRTPGADFELATGFLFAEGLIPNRNAIEQVRYCVNREACEEQQYNVVTVALRPGFAPAEPIVDRNFGMTSSCGLCGKESLDHIERRGLASLPAGARIDQATLCALPDRLRAAQSLFAKTGGLHAAALFTRDGELLVLREDVGRHNAVDKVIGCAMLEGRFPLDDAVLLVSGRSSFEIAQKCVVAGVPILAAISAPSSLAVDLAKRFNLTLIGFLRGDKFNIYHGATRISLGNA